MKWPFFSKQALKPGGCCFYILPDKLCLARVSLDDSSRLTLSALVEEQYTDDASLERLLTRLIKTYHLEETACVWLLAPEEYALFLLEKPMVSRDEMLSALRWQVKQLLSFPADQALLQYFELPKINAFSKKEEIYVVAVKRTLVELRAQCLRSLGLSLSVIDIPELALCQLLNRLQDRTGYVGLLLMYPQYSQLLIFYEGQLLFQHHIPFDEQATHAIAEEIQHTFALYAGQQATVHRKLYVYPATASVIRALSSELDMLVSSFPLIEILPAQEALTNDALIAMSGTLRFIEVPHATN